MAIFMIGTQRSGSNLLRLMLNQIPGISAPHPPDFLEMLMPIIDGYGDLEDDQNFYVLVEDVCKLIELNPVPWEGVEIDRDQIIAEVRRRSLLGVVEAIYDLVAVNSGSTEWVCTSLVNNRFLPDIEPHFGMKAKYLYLYRDGRDVAVSYIKTPMGEKHFYHLAKEWSYTQKLIMNLSWHIGPDRFYGVSYEDLVSNPEKVMRGVCEFVGALYSDRILQFYEEGEARRTAAAGTLWSNTVQPVIRENFGHFVEAASEEDIRIFESVAGDMLDQLGYERCYVNKGEEIRFSNAQLREFDEINEYQKAIAYQAESYENRQRFGAQYEYLESIRNRHKAKSIVAA